MQLKAHLGSFKPLFTEAPGHATALARQALAQGARRFVAVGGDGTVNETLNGLLEPSGRLSASDAVLCPVPAGTANELCRALGHLEHPMGAYKAAAGTGTRPVDLLRVRCVDLSGQPVDRFGYLIVSLGAAATMSSMDSGLNKNAGVFIKSFYQPVLRPAATERELLRAGKATTFRRR